MKYYPRFFALIFSLIAGFLLSCLHWLGFALQGRREKPKPESWRKAMCGKAFLARKLVLAKVRNGSFFMRVAG